MTPHRIFSAIAFVVVLSLTAVNFIYITQELNWLNDEVIKVQSIGRQIYIDQALLLERMKNELEEYDYSSWETETKYINHYIDELDKITHYGLAEKNYWKSIPLNMRNVVEFDSDLNGLLATGVEQNYLKIESLKKWQMIMFISIIAVILLTGIIWTNKIRIDKRNDEWYKLNKKSQNESK